jgi:hypothetical protein
VFVCVYRGSGPLDAYLVSHWLERLGIVVQVRGGDLASIRGKIPIMDAWPSLWVPKDQAVAATDGIRSFEAEAALATAWTCPACDEDNEPSFGSCWSCQTDRPAGR